MRLSSTAFILSAIVSTASAFAPIYNTNNNIITSRNVLADNTASEASSADTAPSMGKPGTAKLDTPWEELGFEFRPTKSNLRITYKDGEWGEMELCEVRIYITSMQSVLAWILVMLGGWSGKKDGRMSLVGGLQVG